MNLLNDVEPFQKDVMNRIMSNILVLYLQTPPNKPDLCRLHAC